MKAWVNSAVLVALLAGGWVVYAYPPGQHTFYPRCVFKAATGWDCPGCGSTRAVHQLLHGNVAAAFRLNPFLFLLGAVALCAVPSLVRGQSPRFVAQPWFGWATVFTVTAWWILRNTLLRVS